MNKREQRKLNDIINKLEPLNVHPKVIQTISSLRKLARKKDPLRKLKKWQRQGGVVNCLHISGVTRNATDLWFDGDPSRYSKVPTSKYDRQMNLKCHQDSGEKIEKWCIYQRKWIQPFGDWYLPNLNHKFRKADKF